MHEPNPINSLIAMVGTMIAFAIVVCLMLAMLAISQILAVLPWLILTTGISTALIVHAVRSSRNKQPEQPTKIIERQVIVLPVGTPRREVWQAWSDNQADVVVIEAGEERN